MFKSLSQVCVSAKNHAAWNTEKKQCQKVKA